MLLKRNLVDCGGNLFESSLQKEVRRDLKFMLLVLYSRKEPQSHA